MKQDTQQFNQGLLDFISNSPTPFHAVEQMTQKLFGVGFEQLQESEDWDLKPGKGYWVTRNGSSVIAFHTGNDPSYGNGIRLVGAHTDSPCLKVKPHPELDGHGCQRLAAEIYGGVLLSPWFDRDLSLAGRVTYTDSSGRMSSTLLDFKKPIAHIPSLAIHLNRKANEEGKIQRHKELNLVLALSSDKLKFAQVLADQLSQHLDEVVEVIDHEIFAYDTQQPALTGLNDDFINSARLDNLLSCYIGVDALLNAEEGQPRLLVCNDHEEVGSQSACGAQGPFLRDVLERICRDGQHLSQVLSRSMLISADNAHAIHPNYPEKHDSVHGPKINAGPVIKVNANQRYATNSETSTLFKQMAKEVDVDVQTFVSRNDMACGSTIGPITASELGVATIDVGCPQWGMHSIRETAGTADGVGLSKILARFFSYDKPLRLHAQQATSI